MQRYTKNVQKRLILRKKKLKEIKHLDLSIMLLKPQYKCKCLTFNSGKGEFNHFLCKDAWNDMENGDGVTYLIVNRFEKYEEIIAYFQLSTFAMHTIDRYDFEDEDIPEAEKRIHYVPIKSFMIDMFAIDKKYQDSIWNDMVVSDVIFKLIISEIQEMSKTTIGGKLIILGAVKDSVKFYLRNNFKKMNKFMTLFDKDTSDVVPMYFGLYDLCLPD